MRKTLKNSTALVTSAMMLCMSLPMQIQAQEVTDCTIEANLNLEACAAAAAAEVEKVAPEIVPEPAAEEAPVEPVEPEIIVEPAPADEIAPAVEAPKVELEPTPEVAPNVEVPLSVEPGVEATPIPEDAPRVEEAPLAEKAPEPNAPEAKTDVDGATLEAMPAESNTTQSDSVTPEALAVEEAPKVEPLAEEKAAAPAPEAKPATDAKQVAPASADTVTGTSGAAEALRGASAAPAETVKVTEPVAVLPDQVTDQQRAELQAQEQARRDEAKKNRNVLLGALAAGAVVGALVPALGGTVVEDQGDRIIVENNGNYTVRRDESALLRDGDVEVAVRRLSGGRTLETVTRRNGSQILTVRDEGGYIISRSRIRPDGTEVVLIDNTGARFRDVGVLLPGDFPPPPRDIYIVSAERSDSNRIYRTFLAPPVAPLPNQFTLREVRDNVRVRDLVARVDLDQVTFESGSAFVNRKQLPFIAQTAQAASDLIAQDPAAILLVEGHTDAVGSDISNLALSDRRAETVARILVDQFGIPAENLVVQGYGEQFLKVNTQSAERANRRVTLRNISPLLAVAQN